MGERLLKSHLKNDNNGIFPVANPSVTQQEVIVCFADIRDFTSFVQQTDDALQGYAHKLLSQFYLALNDAFNETRSCIGIRSEFGENVVKYSWPNLRKTLGDGIVLVWEFPAGISPKLKDGLKIFVIDFIQRFQTRFYEAKEILQDMHAHMNELIENLHIGLGLASGYAWKLSGLGSKDIDYTGTIINIAARLQDQARPFGLVADFRFTQELFFERVSMFNEGEIKYIPLKGLTKMFPVWSATHKTIISLRCSRAAGNLHELKNYMYRIEETGEFDDLSLSYDDTMNIFQIRETFEAQFAADLANLVKQEIVFDDAINETFLDLTDEKFHMGIASLSANDKNEAEDRMKFIVWVHNCTAKIRLSANFTEEKVKTQQMGIIKAIKRGNGTQASKLMKDYLHEIHKIGKSKFLIEMRDKNDCAEDTPTKL